MTAMLRVVSLFFIVFALALPAIADTPPDSVRTVFQIDGMHCGGCSSAITGELEKIDGVTTASADHEKGTAEAVYDSRKVDPKVLKDSIEKLGYTVTGMESASVEG